jgi:hypothetical protein
LVQRRAVVLVDLDVPRGTRLFAEVDLLFDLFLFVGEDNTSNAIALAIMYIMFPILFFHYEYNYGY